MSIFDGKRLTNETFKLDVERMRRGWYSDKYFENINRMLTALSAEGYRYSGAAPQPARRAFRREDIAVGDIEVEMQWFTPPAGQDRGGRRGQGAGHAPALHRLSSTARSSSIPPTSWKSGLCRMAAWSSPMATR